MANETAYFGETLKSGSGMMAAGDLTAAQFHAVVINASGEIELAAAGATGVKILNNKPNVGENCHLTDIGENKAVAGGAILKGAKVEVGTGGKFVTKGTGAAVGECRVPAAADGDVITIFLLPT